LFQWGSSAWADTLRALVSADIGQIPPLVHRRNFEKFVGIVAVDTWKQFQDLVSARFFDKQWVFRGQSQYDWRLETSLERAVVRYREGEPDGSYPVSHPNKFEPQLLQGFQRRANHYMSDVPAHGERLEWLALMQHYGVPTRLLDWTISPYVALYFALEKSVLNSDCAIWVVDSNWVTERARETLGSPDRPFPGTADLRHVRSLSQQSPGRRGR